MHEGALVFITMGEDVAIVTVFFVAPKFSVFIAQMTPTSIALTKVIDAVFAVSGFAIFTLFEGKVCSVLPTIIAFRHDYYLSELVMCGTIIGTTTFRTSII